MILRDKGTHYEVEMFHIINLGKQNPEFNFNEYLTQLAKEFIAELNTTRFAVKTNIEYKPVTQSHTIVEDKELKV